MTQNTFVIVVEHRQPRHVMRLWESFSIFEAFGASRRRDIKSRFIVSSRRHCTSHAACVCGATRARGDRVCRPLAGRKPRNTLSKTTRFSRATPRSGDRTQQATGVCKRRLDTTMFDVRAFARYVRTQTRCFRFLRLSSAALHVARRQRSNLAANS